MVSCVKEDQFHSTLDQWFFIRYSDHSELLEQDEGGARLTVPRRTHLRLRFHGSPSALTVICERLRESVAVHDYGSPTIVEANYQPELRRYGGRIGINAVHPIFMTDSLNAVALQSAVRSDTLVAAVSAHEFLRHLGLEKHEIHDVYRRRLGRIAQELGMSADRLAKASGMSHAGLGSRWIAGLAAVHANQVVQSNVDHLRAAALPLRRAAHDGSLTRDVLEVYVDLHHLHFNRLGVAVRQELSLVLFAAEAFTHTNPS